MGNYSKVLTDLPVTKKHTLPPNLLVLAVLFFSVHILSSCRDVSKIELIEDIDAYVYYIEHVHADPYRLITREN